MVYDQDKGFIAERTLLQYAKDLGLINGSRINARYLGTRDDVKFNEKDIVNEYQSREEVRLVFDEILTPHLNKLLSRVGIEEERRIGDDNEGIDADLLYKIVTEV